MDDERFSEHSLSDRETSYVCCSDIPWLNVSAVRGMRRVSVTMTSHGFDHLLKKKWLVRVFRALSRAYSTSIIRRGPSVFALERLRPNWNPERLLFLKS